MVRNSMLCNKPTPVLPMRTWKGRSANRTKQEDCKNEKSYSAQTNNQNAYLEHTGLSPCCLHTLDPILTCTCIDSSPSYTRNEMWGIGTTRSIHRVRRFWQLMVWTTTKRTKQTHYVLYERNIFESKCQQRHTDIPLRQYLLSTLTGYSGRHSQRWVVELHQTWNKMRLQVLSQGSPKKKAIPLP